MSDASLTMTTMSTLPRDLVEEILSRVPLTSLKGFRSVCKKWNTLSKDPSFTKKHLGQAATARGKEFLVAMVIDFRVYLMSVNLHKDGNFEPLIKLKAKLNLDDSNEVGICKVCHCDGLLLCSTGDDTKFFVWNPYWGQTLWLKPTNHELRLFSCTSAIGYEESSSCRNYKILRCIQNRCDSFVKCEIYELNSNSLRAFDVTSHRELSFYRSGVSLKGNTYWCCQHRYPNEAKDYLICFDFTKERFGPRLPLPIHNSLDEDNCHAVTLSVVREEQLAMLLHSTFHMNIWVTNKIEPNSVSWKKLFLAVDLRLSLGPDFNSVSCWRFFIEEETIIVVFFDNTLKTQTRINTAYIIGENGYMRKVEFGESKECWPFGCSYVPSSVEIIKQALNYS